MKAKRVFSPAQEKAIRIAVRTGQFGKYIGEQDRTGVALQRVGVMRRRRSGSNEFNLTPLGRLVAEALEARGTDFKGVGGAVTGRMAVYQSLPAPAPVQP